MKRTLALALALVLALTLVACSGNNGGSTATTPPANNTQNGDNTSDATTQSTDSAADTATASPDDANEHDEGDTVFNPQDVSDETIKQISTYDDYLLMYQMIIEDYFAKYEAAVKDTILYSKDSFDTLKKSYESSLEQQREAYATMGSKRIIGKDTLVEFLINYRDSLGDAVESVAESLNIG